MHGQNSYPLLDRHLIWGLRGTNTLVNQIKNGLLVRLAIRCEKLKQFL